MNFQIPDEALDQLRALLEQDGEMQWAIGDFIAGYWTEMLNYVKPEEIRSEHAELIRQFAKGTGADRTTLRDREKMSLFFAKTDRLLFPMFSYHQFRALRKAGEDKWLDWAVLANDNNWSVAQIRKEMAKQESPSEVLLKQLIKLGKLTGRILEDESVPQEVRTSLSLIPTILEDTKELVYEQAQQ